MRRLVSYQPQLFPRLHYFARILDSDIFSIADYVQYVRKHSYHAADGSSYIGPSYQSHMPIKSATGIRLLDVPTRHEGRQSINETLLAFSNAKERMKNFRIIAENYRASPRASEVLPQLEAFFMRPHVKLSDLTIDSIFFALSLLLEEAPGAAWDTVRVALAKSSFRLRIIERASESSVPPSDKERGRDANDWLIDLCRAYQADEYYFGGTGADAYMDFTKFTAAGITLTQQQWTGVKYPQLHGDFAPNLSIVDLLLNVEPSQAREILKTV